ncbi:unnamed protein product [Sphagnum tenellum]
MGSLLSFSPARMINQCMKIYFNSCGLFSRIVELDNGTTMHCWMPQTVAVKGSSSLKLAHTDDKKPALVFLHAFGADAFTWCRQISRFSKCFDLYIPDLLFCGDSYTTNSSRTEFFQAECVLELLQQLNVFKFSVVGTSYGGFVAYRLAHLYPHAVHKLVLSSSGVNMTPDTDQALVDKFGTENVAEVLMPSTVEGLRRAWRLAIHSQPLFPVPSFICEDVLETVFNKNRKEKLELLDGLQLRKPDAPPLPKVTQDTLIIWGESDGIFNVSLAYDLKEYIGDNAEVVVLKHAGHAPQLEKAKEYNRVLMTFLRQVSLSPKLSL